MNSTGSLTVQICDPFQTSRIMISVSVNVKENTYRWRVRNVRPCRMQ